MVYAPLLRSKMEAPHRLFVLVAVVTTLQMCSCNYQAKPCHTDFRDTSKLDCSGHNLTRIPDVKDYKPNTIKGLWLNTNNITTVTAGALNSFITLTLLKMDSNHIHRLDGKVFGELHHLKQLYLQDNDIQTIDDITFDGLLDLEILDLRRNPISRLPGKTFRELNSLKELHLSMCYFPQLQVDQFFGLENLHTLSVEMCNVSQIENGVFSRVPNVTWLSLQGNRLSALDGAIFRHLSKLEVLDLSHNRLVKIVANLCVHTPLLENLTFSYNPLEEINFGDDYKACNLANLHLVSVTNMSDVTKVNKSFEGLTKTNLTQLDYRGNVITIGDYELFQGFNNLSILDFSSRTIVPFTATSSLGSTAEVQRSNIHTLRLSNNTSPGTPSLTVLTLIDFATKVINESYLKELDISQNGLSILLNDSFLAFPSLEVLNIAHNLIRNIEVCAFRGLHKLRHLSLRDNNLWTIVPHTFDISRNFPLEFLDLSENVLAYYVDDAFIGLKNLLELRLADQGKIRILEENFDDLPSLQKLDISGNTWADQFYLPLCKMPNLTLLNISHAWVKSKKAFPFDDISVKCQGFVSNLKTLDFKASFVDNCKNVEDYFSRNWHAFQKLQKLFLSFLIHYEPDYFPWGMFSNLSRLEVLKLKGNRIQTIPPGAFSKLTRLSHLDLSWNSMASFETLPCEDLKHLKTLCLNKNAIEHIDGEFFKKLPNLTQLYLNGNRFDCSCPFIPFRHFIDSPDSKRIHNLTSNFRHYDERPYWFQDYVCDVPIDLHGKTIADFNPYSTLKCEPSIIFTVALMSLAALAVGVTILVKFFRYQIRYVWFIVKLKLNCHRYEPMCDDQEYEYDVNISNSDADEDWVVHTLLPWLEGTKQLKVHLKVRDLKPGTTKPRYVADLIYKKSRKTLFVISESFITNGTCMQELYVAFQKLFDEHMNIMVFVNLEEIPDNKQPRVLRFPLCKKRANKWWLCKDNETRKAVFWLDVEHYIDEVSKVNHITQIH